MRKLIATTIVGIGLSVAGVATSGAAHAFTPETFKPSSPTMQSPMNTKSFSWGTSQRPSDRLRTKTGVAGVETDTVL